MPRILVIDDEEMIRSLLREVLQQDGHEIVEASDGQVGIEQYREQDIDLIITDILMPGKDGFETIRELTETHPGIKIIALTGYGLHNLPVAYDLGASKVFEKPINPRDLRQAVKDLLNEE
ncbi:MAG: response regulator [Candidatus Latescibacteria bacterium]|nr:response regulator [Candidatus Latescibacterota bacterium]